MTVYITSYIHHYNDSQLLNNLSQLHNHDLLTPIPGLCSSENLSSLAIQTALNLSHWRDRTIVINTSRNFLLVMRHINAKCNGVKVQTYDQNLLRKK